MKPFRMFVMVGLAAASVISPCALQAQSTTAPIIVPQDRDDRDLLKDLQGVPDNVKALIVTFDQTRDKYLRQQHLLLIKLRKATTPEERQAIREQLQENRQDFLNQLKSFRQQLKDDLQAIKGTISHQEFLRIIDAAHDAAGEGRHHHRGK